MPRIPCLRPQFLAAALLIALPASAHEHHQEDLARQMTAAAAQLLDSLNDEKRAAASLPFEPGERESFHYVPLARQGALYKDMNLTQRANTLHLLHTALSDSGSMKAVSIMELERVLAEIEQNPTHRDPERYWIAIFGTPGQNPWGWRFEGHHLSVNQTITDEGISGTPLFMGANPGRVPHGPRQGERVLGDSEDGGREFLLSLTAAQQDRAIISEQAIYEIETGQNSLVEPLDHAGIPYGALEPGQQDRLVGLVRLYLDRHEKDIAAAARARIEAHGWETLVFAWAGSADVGNAHYYRIQGPTFVIEYANTQNNANHHHTVFRDFENDFGRDALREHYRTSH